MRLQSKFLAALLVLAAFSGVGILHFSKRAVSAILVEGAAQRGLRELGELSKTIGDRMQSKDEKALLSLLNASAGETRAVYAMVLDNSGVVLAHTNVLEWRKTYADGLTRRALGRDQPGFEQAQAQGARIVDVSMPIWGAVVDEDFLLAQEKGGKVRIGTLRMGLALQEEFSTLDRILREIGLILLLALGLKMLLDFIFLRRILRPIISLAELAEKIGSGERDARIPVATRDEIGDLANSFNRMIDNLKQKTVSKDYVDGIIESMADGLFVVAPDGSIKTANRAAANLLGYAPQELIGMPIEALRGKDELASARGLRELLLEGRVLRDYESDFRTKGGERIPILLSGTLLRDREGKTEGVVVLAKDMRERKRFEMRLVQSEKLSAVGQLAAGVAHEINNPLGIILGFAQSATKRLQPSDALSLPIKSIEREAMRCKNLVQNLLTFSRQNHPRVEDVDLNETVAATLNIIESQARVKSVGLVTEFGALEPVLGDKNQVQQVIVNLCNNAIDAMPDGGKLTVRTKAQSVYGERRVVLEIEDTGSGIPPEIQDKIFNPFFTTKEVGKGTGLGLSLVHEIVQKHKGTIQVRSAVGRGTTFIVSLPAKRVGGAPGA